MSRFIIGFMCCSLLLIGACSLTSPNARKVDFNINCPNVLGGEE